MHNIGLDHLYIHDTTDFLNFLILTGVKFLRPLHRHRKALPSYGEGNSNMYLLISNQLEKGKENFSSPYRIEKEISALSLSSGTSAMK